MIRNPRWSFIWQYGIVEGVARQQQIMKFILTLCAAFVARNTGPDPSFLLKSSHLVYLAIIYHVHESCP